MLDYYKILGVSENASQDEIKKSYRSLAKRYHPDVAGHSQEAESKFQEISEAYTILSDESKKEKYDTERKYGSSTSAFEEQQSTQRKNTKKTANPFQGFSSQSFKMNFGDMMFDELNNEKQKKQTSGQVDYADVSNQFAQFFGFRPR